MKPTELANHLKKIASYIDNSSKPSRVAISKDLGNLISRLASGSTCALWDPTDSLTFHDVIAYENELKTDLERAGLTLVDITDPGGHNIAELHFESGNVASAEKVRPILAKYFGNKVRQTWYHG